MAAISNVPRPLPLLISLLLVLLAGTPTSARELELDLVRPGAFGMDLHVALGDPVDTQRELSPHRWLEEFAKPESGYERVTAWYDAEGFVTWARVILVNRLEPATASLLFDLRSGAKRSDGHVFSGGDGGHFLHHHPEGVHFYVREGHVEEIWRTAANADLAAVRKEAQPSWPPRALPVPEVVGEPEGSSIINIEEYFGEAAGEEPVLDVSGAGDLGAIAEYNDEPNDLVERSLRVGTIGVTLELDAEFNPVLKVTAPVHATGFRGQEMLFEGYLRAVGADGSTTVVAASPGAPEGLRASGGALRPQSRDVVRFDLANWEPATLYYPLRWVQGYTGRFSGTFIVTIEVVCDGYAAYAAGRAVVPGAGSVTRPGPTGLQPGEITWEVGELEGFGPGLWCYRPLTVTGAKGLRAGAQVTLRNLAGQPVRAARGHDSWALSDGAFYSRATDEVLHDESTWSPFRNFVPFVALDLPSGEHRLVLREVVSVQSLGAAQEKTITITMPPR